MATHFCPSNPCPLCSPLKAAKGSTFLESGYVFAPYIPLAVTPSIFEEPPGKLLGYPVPVLGHGNLDVGDLVRIVSKGLSISGIYLGSEEFTPHGAFLNSKICIRHIFMVGGSIRRIEEGVAQVTEVLDPISPT